jgi:hypothetical protein
LTAPPGNAEGEEQVMRSCKDTSSGRLTAWLLFLWFYCLRLTGREVRKLQELAYPGTMNVFKLAGSLVSGVRQPNAMFGLPNQRVGQTFGSGGPRAFQLAMRIQL